MNLTTKEFYEQKERKFSRIPVYDKNKDITLDPDNKPANVYNLEGKVVKTNATSVEGLPKGVYIFKNKKYLVE